MIFTIRNSNFEYIKIKFFSESFLTLQIPRNFDRIIVSDLFSITVINLNPSLNKEKYLTTVFLIFIFTYICNCILCGNFLQLRSPIGDHELSAIAREIGSQSMETFARRYLGLDGNQIQTISDSRRDNRDGFKFDILEIWRNRNPGPNVRAVGIAVVVGKVSYYFKNGAVSLDLQRLLARHNVTSL